MLKIRYKREGFKNLPQPLFTKEGRIGNYKGRRIERKGGFSEEL